MTILLLLIPISLLMLAGSIWAFIWAVRKGQFEDMDTPAIDILRDDEHERQQPAPAPPGSESSPPEPSPRPAGPAPTDDGRTGSRPTGSRPTDDAPVDNAPAGDDRPDDRAD